MEFGLSTFGELTPDSVAGGALNAHLRVQELIEEAALADQLGLEVFALGEHHRPDFVISAPEMILAAVAAVTKNIRLSSAVTVLSSAEPVRVYQQYATLDLISSGRAEIMAGRGSFIESFPLFGYDLKDYDELFSEKLELLMHIISHEVVSWKGTMQPSIDSKGVYPRSFQDKIPLWIAVGGTPASVVRAGNLGLPLTLAILGSSPARFTGLTELYKNSWKKAGHEPEKLQLCINEHLYLAETAQKARDEYWPVYGPMMNKIGRERGWSPMDRQYFDRLCASDGPLMVGTSQEVTDKLIAQHELFGYTRFLAQIISGINMDHQQLMHSIELFGKEVAPKVRQQLSDASL